MKIWIQIIVFWFGCLAHSFAEQSIRLMAFFTFFSTDTIDSEADFLTSSAQTNKFLLMWLFLQLFPIIAVTPWMSVVNNWKNAKKSQIALTALLNIFVIAFFLNKNSSWVSLVFLIMLEGAFFFVYKQVWMVAIVRKHGLAFPVIQACFVLASLLGTLGACVAQFQIAPGKDSPVGSLDLFQQLTIFAYIFSVLILIRTPPYNFSTWKLSDRVIGFFVQNVKQVLGHRDTVKSLISMMISVVAITLFCRMQDWFLTPSKMWLLAEMMIGVFLAMWSSHPFRTIALSGYLSVVLFAATNYAYWFDAWEMMNGPIAILLTAIIVPIFSFYQSRQREPQQATGLGILAAVWATTLMVVGSILYFNDYLRPQIIGNNKPLEPLQTSFYYVTQVMIVGIIALHYRPIFEGSVEILLRILYRIKSVGPGVTKLPWRGPGLLVANHGAMLDPLWLAKVVPMPTTPMMVSTFFDLPVISFCMKRIVGTIRVADCFYRREAPEIYEAIDAIGRESTVMIFPEGWLRRDEERPLRRFGQGVFKILEAKPETPVFPCWIENGWGSFFSYKNGPLMKKKPFDFMYPVTIVIGEPLFISKELLKDHRRTRMFLMEKVAATREFLGFPPIPIADQFIFDSSEDEHSGEESINGDRIEKNESGNRIGE